MKEIRVSLDDEQFRWLNAVALISGKKPQVIVRNLIEQSIAIMHGIGSEGGQDERSAIEIVELTLERAKEFAEADADGRLIVLPCHIGDAVFWRYMDCDTAFKETNCSDWKQGAEDKRGCEACPHRHPVAIPRTFTYADIPKYGKSIFLTREEAEELETVK